MTVTPNIPDDLFTRAQTIVGLRRLADYLETHPDVPVKEYGWDYTLYVTTHTDAADTDAGGIDAAGRAEVDRIADILNVTPIDDTPHGGHYWTSTTFGRISYRAVHIPTHAWATHKARDSYRPNITLSLHHDQHHDDQQDGMRDEAA